MSEWDLPSNVQSASIERIGGGGYLWESGVYKATVKLVYLDQAASEAISFNIILENKEGKELKESMWIKSGKSKGNKTYYTKDGKDYPLPGYATANSLCIAATGKPLPEIMKSLEKKTINIYNREQQKEVPTERPVAMELKDKVVTVAVHQVMENKRKKEGDKYVTTAETRSYNECKFFGNADGKTAEEILNNADAVIMDKWAAKNTGAVIDKTVKVDSSPSSAASIMGSDEDTSSANSMFG